MARNILIRGNSKMGPKVHIFNLPPLETCRPSPWCRKNCYVPKGYYHIYESVREAARWRYEMSLRDDFVDLVVAEIKRLEKRRKSGKIGEFYIRLHASGDFYSAEYVGKWIKIAERCPDVRFRTTTRREDFAEDIRRLNALPNFIVRESVDPSRPVPTMGLESIAAVSTTPGISEKDMIFCMNDCEKCGHSCWKIRQGMHFAPH